MGCNGGEAGAGFGKAVLVGAGFQWAAGRRSWDAGLQGSAGLKGIVLVGCDGGETGARVG